MLYLRVTIQLAFNYFSRYKDDSTLSITTNGGVDMLRKQLLPEISYSIIKVTISFEFDNSTGSVYLYTGSKYHPESADLLLG